MVEILKLILNRDSDIVICSRFVNCDFFFVEDCFKLLLIHFRYCDFHDSFLLTIFSQLLIDHNCRLLFCQTEPREKNIYIMHNFEFKCFAKGVYETG